MQTNTDDTTLDLSGVRLFVFDFDGTLVQSNAIKLKSFYDITRHLPEAHSHLDELFRTQPNLDRYGIFRALAERVNDIDPDAMALSYGVMCEKMILKAPEVPGAQALLVKLSQSHRFAIINSATPEAPLRKLVPQLPFGNLINVVYGEPASKAENIKKSMSLCGVGPEQTVMVGDRESDRASAQETNCSFIGVKSDMTDFTISPEVVVTGFHDVITWF